MSLNIVMLGPPGAGKGTQGERLARERGIPRISTGDILREAVQDGTDIGMAAREVMEAGQLVGDDIMIAIVRERLAQPDAAPGFVLDGFPRTVVQAEALETILDGRGSSLVLHLVVPVDELVRRLSWRRVCAQCGANASMEGSGNDACATCGGPLVQRADDDERVVRERLRVFDEQTRPLVAHYRSTSDFFCIDGNQPPDRVAAALREAVRSRESARATVRSNKERS
jgi:adenylate kinase